MTSYKIALRWKIACALLLCIGVFFRFYHLDKKVFWADETRSALRVAGYSLPEMDAEMIRRGLWTPPELQKFQRINAGRGVRDTLRSLANDDPKHPPLFYVLLRMWTGIFGDSPGVLRALAAVLSLLVFPALWLLCRELFFDDPNRDRIAWAALALLAVSPFHVLYAQEAREYSVWTALVVLSSALLLRALRLENWKSWLAYGVALALAFYAHTLTLNVFLVHAIFVVWLHRRQWKKFATASFFAALLFAPWAIFIWQRRGALNDNTLWLAMHSSRWFIVKAWLFNLTGLFFDVVNPQNWPGKAGVLFSITARLMRLLIFVIAAISLATLFRRMSKRSAVFIVLLIAVPFVLFAAPDLVFSGVRSTIGRFMIPCFIGVQLAVASLLAQRLAIQKTRNRWAAVLGVLLICGIVSCVQSSQAEIWWSKAASFYVPRAARTINAAPDPLVVTEPNRNLQTLSSLLKPNVKIEVVSKAKLQKLDFDWSPLDPENDGTIFLYNPPQSVIEGLRARGVQLKKVDADESLWEVLNFKTPA